ncbi:unnamed protein product [Didymodactylos carnosus]|uniref:Uncharacterized protein n=1 Tax=Didymodactylos carnosus TaxID=1234261 RepID=A0A813YF46_9BILA|nr:unnamed protein product [Didymodactylos carnosus]CAF0883266.1 unnamed protein product [Didymodactylos carnosus]CAF3538118.1 unnamed protein product [Didymodactylos carnosus]CAF3669023.1 unnamed protein product [Didymodactylos carnosus]
MGDKDTFVCEGMGNPDEIRKAAGKIRHDIGNVSIVVNNAGVVTCKNVLDLDVADIRKTFAVNIQSHFYINQQFLPAMIDRHFGHIVASYMECLEDEIFRSKCHGVHITIVISGPIKGGLTKKVTEIVIPESVNFMSSTDVARKIVQGVITNQKFLYIPKWYRFLEFMKSFLPYDAFKSILHYVLNVNDPNLKRNRPRPMKT